MSLFSYRAFFFFFSFLQRITTAWQFFIGKLNCTCGWSVLRGGAVCPREVAVQSVDGREHTESGQASQEAKIQQRFNEQLMNAKLSGRHCPPRTAFPILIFLYLSFSGTLASDL